VDAEGFLTLNGIGGGAYTAVWDLYGEGATPVPVPNTGFGRGGLWPPAGGPTPPLPAYGTARETAWESRSSPGLIL